MLLVIFLAETSLFVADVRACGETLTEQTGTLESPGYPDNFINETCTFIIRRPRGERITLFFEHFDVEGVQDGCVSDFAELRDGDSATAPNLFGLGCNQVGREERSFQSNMYTTLHPDSSQTRFRFRINYSSDVLKDNFFLVTSSHGMIFRVDFETHSTIAVPGMNLLDPIAVDFDVVKERIYWTDVQYKVIASAFLDGTDQKALRSLKEAAVPRGLAVDPLSRLVFYTDEGNDVIAMLTMSGSLHKTVISTDLDRPLAVVVDTINGVMFFTDIGQQAKIERANYDGTERKVLHTDFLLQPTALALDLHNSRLYWVDASSDTVSGSTGRVEYSDLDGKNRKRIFSSNDVRFFGMAYYGSYVYVTNWAGNGIPEDGSRIHRLRVDRQEGNTILDLVDRRAIDIHLHIEDAWERGPNGCGNNNGGCSHFCVPSPGNTAKCLCPDAPTECVEANQTVPFAEEAFPTAVVAGAAAGGVVLIIAVAVIVAVIVQKRQSEKEGSTGNSDSGSGPLTQQITSSRANLTGSVNMSHVYDEVSDDFAQIEFENDEAAAPAYCSPSTSAAGYLHPTYGCPQTPDGYLHAVPEGRV